MYSDKSIPKILSHGWEISGFPDVTEPELLESFTMHVIQQHSKAIGSRRYDFSGQFFVLIVQQSLK